MRVDNLVDWIIGRRPIDEFLIDRIIALIDQLVSKQVALITRQPKYIALEASWRGLLHLAATADKAENVRLRFLPVTWQEICRDIERASNFDQSILFRKIYEEEFGLAGGEPFGLIVGDYTISHVGQSETSITDVEALKGLAKIAAAAFCPFVTAAAPALLNLDSFADLRPVIASTQSGVTVQGRPSVFNEMKSHPAYAQWRALREEPDARFVGVVLPRYICRGPESLNVSQGRYLGQSEREVPGPASFLWTSGVYAFAGVVIATYRRTHWFLDMRGARRDDPGCGLVPNLDARYFRCDLAKGAEIAAVEVEIDPTHAAAFDEAGLIPILRATGTGEILFDGNCSIYSPPPGGSLQERSSLRISAMLQYVLCVSRFAHYIKVIGRDQIGVLATPASCQEGLQNWIRQYTTSDDEAPPERIAQYPLRESVIRVSERPGRPGTFICEAHLKPNFLLDQVSSSFAIVTDIAGLS